LFRNQGSGSTGLASIHLVETSLPLREQQAALLQPLADQLGAEIVWYDTLEDVLPDVNVFTGLLAHEFFDALPVRVIQVNILSI
jgi:SAM-dependent MidA family methyltransferase